MTTALGTDTINNWNLRDRLLREIFGFDWNSINDNPLNEDILACDSLEELKNKVKARAKEILGESTENQ